MLLEPRSQDQSADADQQGLGLWAGGSVGAREWPHGADIGACRAVGMGGGVEFAYSALLFYKLSSVPTTGPAYPGVQENLGNCVSG